MKSLPIVAVFILLAFGSIHAQEARFPTLYFSEVTDEIPQLRVLEVSGQARNLFVNGNDGYFNSVSPDGSYLAFVRYEWDVPPSEAQAQLLLANLQTDEQLAIGSSAKAVDGIWSPDGQYLLLHHLDDISPLWAGHNYGRLSLYDMRDATITPLANIQAFAFDWYPDNQRILLWNETTGYFSYSVTDGATQPIEFASLSSDVVRWVDISPTDSGVAVPLYNSLGIYNADDGQIISRISHGVLGAAPEHPYWSPDGRLVAIELVNNNITIWDAQAREILTIVANPIDEAPIGYSFYLQWTVSPQQLFLIVERYEGLTVYRVDIATGQMTEVYEATS